MKRHSRTLAEFFEHAKPKRTHQWLADQLAVDRSYVTLLVNRQRQPSLDMAFRIEAITGVPVKALVTTTDAQEAASA